MDDFLRYPRCFTRTGIWSCLNGNEESIETMLQCLQPLLFCSELLYMLYARAPKRDKEVILLARLINELLCL